MFEEDIQEKLEKLKKAIASQEQYVTICKRCGQVLADNSWVAMIEHYNARGHKWFDKVKK